MLIEVALPCEAACGDQCRYGDCGVGGKFGESDFGEAANMRIQNTQQVHKAKEQRGLILSTLQQLLLRFAALTKFNFFILHDKFTNFKI